MNLPNIEKSAFRRGEYVGYANGRWRIWHWSTCPQRKWIAVRHNGGPRREVFGSTLAELSETLQQIAQSEGLAVAKIPALQTLSSLAQSA